MKNKIYKNIIYFITIFIIILIICLEFIKGFALIDHYNMYNKGYIRYATEEFFKDGRIFSGLYILIANLLNIKINHLYIISSILGICVITLNILYFKEILKRKCNSKEDWIWLILSLITVFNWTCVNNMCYIEAPIIALSIFLYIYSAKKIILDKSIKISFITLIIGLFCYQGTISTYFSMIVFFELLNNENRSDTIKNILKCYLLGIIPIIINFIFIKTYGNCI